MNIKTDEAVLHFYSKPSFEMIYSEAVANALDAEASQIDIKINIPSYEKAEQIQTIIRDNGRGFTDKDFDRFTTLLEKKDAAHKGLGRLIYLNYFDSVEVESVYENTNLRSFVFDSDFDGKREHTESVGNIASYTMLTFRGFKKDKLHTYNDINAPAIKKYLMQTFLPRLFAMKQHGDKFEITIDVTTDKSNAAKDFFSGVETIDQNNLPEFEKLRLEDDTIDLYNHDFNMLYAMDGNTSHGITTAVCVDGRAVNISLGNGIKIPDYITGTFILASPFFDNRTDDSRQSLILEDDTTSKIKSLFLKSISKVLEDRYPHIKNTNKKTIESLSARYPHLQGYFEQGKNVGLIDEDSYLEAAQQKFFKEQKEVLNATKLDDKKYEMSVALAARTLTEYILYRNLIIGKLEEITDKEKEQNIHNLIVPMQHTFTSSSFQSDLYTNNAWLLDDRYMGYHSILSDKNIQKLINQLSDGDTTQHNNLRPDIAIVFSDDVNMTTHPVDVVIIELKKKGLNYLDNTRVIDQLEQRARRLLGLYPDKIQRMWFFGVVDFDDELRMRMKEDWHKLYSRGEVYYKLRNLLPIDANGKQIDKELCPVSMTLMSFDAMCKDAKTRNETFLRILRESIRQYAERISNEII